MSYYLTAILLEAPTTFVGLTALSHDLMDISQPKEYYQVNFGLTKQLYDAFLESEAHFFSSAQYKQQRIILPLTEDHQPNPQTHYGKYKLLAEQCIQNQPLPEVNLITSLVPA